MLEDLGISKANKKRLKHFVEKQEHKDKFGQLVSLLCPKRNINQFREHKRAFGVYIFLMQVKHIFKALVLMTVTALLMVYTNSREFVLKIEEYTVKSIDMEYVA